MNNNEIITEINHYEIITKINKNCDSHLGEFTSVFRYEIPEEFSHLVLIDIQVAAFFRHA